MATRIRAAARDGRVRAIVLTGLLACLGFVHATYLRAAPPDDAFAAQLAAGEFAPALAQARQLPAGFGRDRALSQIAEAQASAGLGRAAQATLGGVGDPTLRGGAPGGGVQADFDALIELITTTVQPDSWDANGGEGAIEEFATGVYFDPEGVLRSHAAPDPDGKLAELRSNAARFGRSGEARRSAPLRKVSLARLDRELQLRRAAGELLPEEMLALAGLQRIEYVFVYPESGDVVLAGPAGDWQRDAGGRLVAAETGRPVVLLDDLAVVLQFMLDHPGDTFGCAIRPRQEALAETQAFLQASAAKPLKPGQRNDWLRELRDHVGLQDIEVYGLSPTTHAARVLVEADYHMKLVGIGLAEGTAETPSYLSLLQRRGGQQQRLDVLRWWFTLNYQAVLAAADGRAFQLRGQGAQVLSENELLTALGERVHTGQSDELNQDWADRFTSDFEHLAQKYPIYAELQNVCDLALVAAIVSQQALVESSGWRPAVLGVTGEFAPAQNAAPATVETVANHCVVDRKQILAVVSGGVRIDPWSLASSENLDRDSRGELGSTADQAQPPRLPERAWWWD